MEKNISRKIYKDLGVIFMQGIQAISFHDFFHNFLFLNPIYFWILTLTLIFVRIMGFFSFCFRNFFPDWCNPCKPISKSPSKHRKHIFLGKFSNCWVLIPKFFLNSHPISPSYSFFIYLTQNREFMDREGLYIGFPLKSLNFSSDIGTYFFGLRLCCSCCWIDRKGLPLLNIPSFQPGEKRV